MTRNSEDRVERVQLLSAVAGCAGLSMVIFGAGLGLDAGWNAIALIVVGVVLTALGLYGLELARRRAVEQREQEQTA